MTIVEIITVVEVVVACCSAAGCWYSYRLVRSAEADAAVVHLDDARQRVPPTTWQILDLSTRMVRSQQRAWATIQFISLGMTLLLIARPFSSLVRVLLFLSAFFTVTVIAAVSAYRADRTRVQIQGLQATADAAARMQQRRSTDV